MSKRQLSALLGFWVIIFLFLGFPIGWDKWIAVVSGILIIIVAYKRPSRQKPLSNNAFVQNSVISNDVNVTSTATPSTPVENSESLSK